MRPQFFPVLCTNINIFQNHSLSLFDNANLVLYGVLSAQGIFDRTPLDW